MLSIQDQRTCIPCSHCQQPSAGRCVTCELFMCEKCIQSHNGYLGFKDHVVLTMEELSKPENQSKIKGKSYCKKHSSKKLKLYCETCEELICTYCVVFEHVRPDHICSPLEEIARRKRKELKTICQTLEYDDSLTSALYDDLAVTSFYLEQNLEALKEKIHQEKDRVLASVERILQKKAQSVIQETTNIAKQKNRAIDKELKRISEHKAGQKKVYDTATALVDNGSNEEIMLSYKSVQQSIENGAKEYERTVEIDEKMPEYCNEKLSNMFLNEIKAIEGGKPGNFYIPIRTGKSSYPMLGHCRTCLVSLSYPDQGSPKK